MSWANEVGMVTLYREKSMCKGLEITCSLTHCIHHFYKYVPSASCLCTTHKGYKVSNDGIYSLIECFSQLKLSYALVTTNCQISVAYDNGDLFLAYVICSLLLAERRDDRTMCS